MTAPGYVPRPVTDLVDRVAVLEKRLRNMQQNVAGATVAGGGVPLSTTSPQPIGAASAGSANNAARGDHVHASSLAAQQDVTVSSPVTGQGLQYSGSGWVNVPLVVSSTAAVTSPYTGQVVYNTTLNQLQYYSGATNGWLTQTAYARYYISANQGVGSGDNVVSFPNVDTPDTRIVVSGNSFVVAPGPYTFDCSLRLNDTRDAGVYFVTGTAASESTAFGWGTQVSNNVLVGGQATKTFTSTTTVSVVLWVSSATSIIPYGANGTHLSIQRAP